VASTIEILKQTGGIEYTVLVVAEANAVAGFRYLVPFSGCAIAEHWMRMGNDVLVIYDDLSLHAQSYRELSLLLHRPPGREAYPSDIFYLHSRLLERSTILSPEKGGGSMTALPIVETRLGEIAAYVPTNLISITDGQIYFDSHLFASGQLPAIDIGRSVSRIGGKAQHAGIKNAAAHIRLDYLQFLEMELFARFGTRLETSVQEKLKRGRILRELLKQDRLAPVSERCHMAWLHAYGDGVLNSMTPDEAANALPVIFEAVENSELKLDDPKTKWIAVIREALGVIDGTAT
jgi:F-type H+-transporting ATPase subunit alpha